MPHRCATTRRLYGMGYQLPPRQRMRSGLLSPHLKADQQKRFEVLDEVWAGSQEMRQRAGRAERGGQSFRSRCTKPAKTLL